MYDDLARAQRPSALEWLVVNALIPSVLVTLAFHWPHGSAKDRPSPEVITTAGFLVPPDGLQPGDPEPDAFPVLIRMPDPVYPKFLRRAGVGDHVLIRALVTPDGRVDPASILAVQAIYPSFVASARQALSRAQFRPARFGGRPGAAWVTISIDFTFALDMP